MNASKLTTWIKAQRRLAVTALALALAGTAVTYEIARPAAARAAALPSTAPLDANQVDALLSLDKAMETVAARRHLKDEPQAERPDAERRRR